METEWDKKIVSQELLLYLREQLISALETKRKDDRRFYYVSATATLLTDAIWSKQEYSAIAGILEDMNYCCGDASIGVWFKCDSSEFSIEKIEAIYAGKTDSKD